MTEEIKPKSVWITKDRSGYYLWSKKPWWSGYGWCNAPIITSVCAREARKYIGKIPKHVIKGGEKAISRGYLYCAADWEEE